MEYISTKGRVEPSSFLEAMETGLAADGGLYVPKQWPGMPELWNGIQGRSIQEIGTTIAKEFIPEIAANKLNDLVSDALPFDAPLVHLRDGLFILELFHGPTLAFKDFGACFMAQMMDYHARQSGQRTTILVATSGDTGSAVGRAFEDAEGVDVCLLYPSGKVSKLQERQLTTIGGNVTALEVEGTFDDCQKLVKEAFSDPLLQKKLRLSSANSINIGRLLPQIFYYGRALAQIEDDQAPHFCVPSGNFGNITAGMMAKKTGMPAHQFLAATNQNDTVPTFLSDGQFQPQPSQQTISSAMDVGNPSNIERIRNMFPDLSQLRQHLWAASFDDKQTRSAIKRVYEKHKYVLDPHTAVGYLAARKYQKEEQSQGPVIILGTAHPAKFADIVTPLIGSDLPLPHALKQSLAGKKRSMPMTTSYKAFQEFLIDRYA